jgi:hypothetical protein
MKSVFKFLSALCINLVFALLSLCAFSSNNALLVDDHQSKVTPLLKEKIYIHFDKTFYEHGENIWYKIYLVDAINHTPETLSKVVYVDLIGPNHNIIESKTIKISEGIGKGDFKLNAALPNGEYTVRAYTNFMRNFDDSYFFTKKILVNSLESNSSFNADYVKPSIRFFPEGGNMISNFLNRIVVKTKGVLKNEAVITGEVLDDINSRAIPFEISKFGMGSFQFIPEKGRTYTAIVYHNGEKYTYPLPQVIDYGATIRIDKTYHGYRVSVYSSLANGTNDLELIGIQKGDIVCRAKLNSKSSEAAIDLQKADLMPGVIQFQLLNKKGTVLSEELAFIEANNLDEKVTVVPSKKTYGNNEQVELAINFDPLLEEDLQANMSVSVTEVNPIIKNVSDLDITAHLLLNSEIRDNLEQFGSYFSNDSIRKRTINQLLIAQEDNQHLFNNTTKGHGNTVEFLPESGFSISGVVKGKNTNKKPVKANVAISYKNGKELGYDETTTDSLGRFSFNNLDFDDRTFISLKAKSLKSKNYGNYFTIELDSASKAQYKHKKTPANNGIVLESKIEYNRNTEFAPEDGEIKLDAVKIAAEKKRLDRFAKKRKANLYTSTSHTLDFKDLRISPSAHNPIHALQGLFPGVHYYGGVYGGVILIRGRNSLTGNNEPLYLLDGLPTDRDMIESMSFQVIDFIDIIKGPRAGIYGLRGGNGVIAVYTLDGSEESDAPNDRENMTSFYHPGYYQARTFNPNENNSSTLYWNPDIKVNPSDNTKIKFNAANKSGTYKVLLEGITSNGTPFKAETYFDVN